jgi:hypothetical protein
MRYELDGDSQVDDLGEIVLVPKRVQKKKDHSGWLQENNLMILSTSEKGNLA